MNGWWRRAAAGGMAFMLTTSSMSAPAWAAKAASKASYGADVSYPQCGSALPSGLAFGIAGVTGGRVFSQNGCLGAELAWAISTGKGSLYTNTADPSTISAEWAEPSGNPEGFANYTVVPPPGGYEPCDPTTDASFGCDWDYGWNSAQYAYEQAESAATSAGVALAKLAAVRWWLDVETANSWTIDDSAVTWSATQADAADLQGAIAGLEYAQQQLARANGLTITMPAVGVYTSASAWQAITGSARFASDPDWVPGARTERQAISDCQQSPPTGSEVMLSQWTSSLDYDYPCPVSDQSY